MLPGADRLDVALDEIASLIERGLGTSRECRRLWSEVYVRARRLGDAALAAVAACELMRSG